jgi:hypothetical protein
MQEIYVDLVSTGESNPAWEVTFPDGGDVECAGEETLFRWVIQTAPIRAAITAVTIQDGEPGGVPWSGGVEADLPSAANEWTATDENVLIAGDPPVSYEYSVTITYQGVPYTSDPKITNKPPTHLCRVAPKA